ncbi:alpha/beta hydrolase [Gilvimarinus sp. SDUM040013]|uniref:Alpha/beta hydrolase n=1 Tax=Gilvimarinus gilvus TaxID=3058038 RepID=A0ABU4S6B4_9GAMM|nr:alpha/beta hydrolase [Gilvimarinus sp. SDUM040013]MDO3384912.1 alpha/beta hydrolase [Gilvimarinus sp. SDUM040013]MDX6851453.1 alpha/beta hydrolase [Gilvimarinus sp. SDUM040013]
MTRSILILVLSLFTFTGCGGGSSSSAPSVSSSSSSSSVPPSMPKGDVTVNRVSWGPLDDQFGDLYLPTEAQASPFPLVVMIHGGCWQLPYGLEYTQALSHALALRGLAVWNIEYRRLGGGGEWPNLFKDVAKAADYVSELALSYPVDPQQVVSMGHSAGGHLALWLASRDKIDSASVLYSDAPLALSGAVSLAGVADLSSRVCSSIGQLLINADSLSPLGLGQRMANTSPIEMLPIGLPTLLIGGAADTIVPPRISQSYTDAALIAGDMSEYMVISGANHFDLIDPEFMDLTLLTDAVEGMVDSHSEYAGQFNVDFTMLRSPQSFLRCC